MKQHSIVATLLVSLFAIMAFSPAAAQYESNFERLAKLSPPVDVYHFFDGDRKQVVSYKTDRIMRVCLGDNRHVVPLRVIHDEDTATVERNDCIRVEAKEVFLEPAEPLDANVVLRAEVETLN